MPVAMAECPAASCWCPDIPLQPAECDPAPMISNNNRLKVFSGRANIPLAEKICRCLGDTLGKVTLTNFPDGEISVRIDEDVRGRDVFVVQPTCPPVNDN